MKKITDDVQAVVDHLKKQLGATWHAACVARAHGHSKIVSPIRAVHPWVSRNDMLAEQGGNAFREWIRGHLDSKVTWAM